MGCKAHHRIISGHVVLCSKRAQPQSTWSNIANQSCLAQQAQTPSCQTSNSSSRTTYAASSIASSHTSANMTTRASKSASTRAHEAAIIVVVARTAGHERVQIKLIHVKRLLILVLISRRVKQVVKPGGRATADLVHRRKDCDAAACIGHDLGLVGRCSQCMDARTQ